MQKNIEFELRAVAYIDVLGFKQLVNQSQTSSDALLILSDLIRLLKEKIPKYNKMAIVPEKHIPFYTSVSDSIILSTPLENINMTYDGLITVVLRAIQLTLFLLNKGFLVRGGISVGNFYHDELQAIIVGPAYQEAVAIEQSISMPCIMLSDSAMKHYNDTLSQEWKLWCDNMFLRNGYYSNYMVNGMNSAYFHPIFGNEADENVYTKIDGIIQREYELLKDPKAKEKWLWFWNYFIETVKKNKMESCLSGWCPSN